MQPTESRFRLMLGIGNGKEGEGKVEQTAGGCRLTETDYYTSDYMNSSATGQTYY